MSKSSFVLVKSDIVEMFWAVSSAKDKNEEFVTRNEEFEVLHEKFVTGNKLLDCESDNANAPTSFSKTLNEAVIK